MSEGELACSKDERSALTKEEKEVYDRFEREVEDHNDGVMAGVCASYVTSAISAGPRLGDDWQKRIYEAVMAMADLTPKELGEKVTEKAKEDPLKRMSHEKNVEWNLSALSSIAAGRKRRAGIRYEQISLFDLSWKNQ